jgi:hypothetical protein
MGEPDPFGVPLLPDPGRRMLVTSVRGATSPRKGPCPPRGGTDNTILLSA